MTAGGPSGRTPRRSVAIPEMGTLRELRHALARGGMPPVATRTPEDHARLATFRVIQALLALFEEYRRRIERGERCGLVERQHPHEPDRLVIEIGIEAQP